MQSLEVYHTTAMVAAPEGPAGADVREHHHRMLRALRELAGDFAGRAMAAGEIEKNQVTDTVADDEDDPE